MPYINIKLAGTLNRDQKETIAKEITNDNVVDAQFVNGLREV